MLELGPDANFFVGKKVFEFQLDSSRHWYMRAALVSTKNHFRRYFLFFFEIYCYCSPPSLGEAVSFAHGHPGIPVFA